MAKKEKEEKKDKKEKKNKKEKKDKKKNDKSEKNENDKKQSKSSVALNVSVCGSPSAVQLYLDTVSLPIYHRSLRYNADKISQRF